MAIRLPTAAETNSALRHVYTAIGAIVAVLVYIGLNPDVVNRLTAAVHQIGDGTAQVIAGVTALIPIVSAIFAAFSASPFARLLRMNNDPDVAQVKMVPGTVGAALADKIPGSKVSS